MDAFKTPDELANHIIMEAQEPSTRVFVVLEGWNDQYLFAPHLHAEHALLLVAGSRELAEDAVRILNDERGDLPVIAILDADFERFEGRNPPAPNIFWTDGHDAEVMMLQSPALEKVLRERGSPNKLLSFTEDTNIRAQARAVHAALLARGRVLGALLLHNLRAELALSFKDLKLDRALEEKTWKMNEDKLINLVREKNPLHRLQNAALKVAITPILTRTDADDDLCRGHDLTTILAVGLGRVLGSERVDAQSLERELRLAFDTHCFQATALHVALVGWLEAREDERHLLR